MVKTTYSTVTASALVGSGSAAPVTRAAPLAGSKKWSRAVSTASSRRLAALFAQKGIRHELDLWGHDVPHDWPSWRAQIAHHLPRFC